MTLSLFNSGRVAPVAILSMLAIVGAVAPAHATSEDAFPSKPVRIVVPYAPGGIADMQARLLAQRLGARWGQSVIVENRPGGNTIVGTVNVVKAPPDCSVLLLGTLATVLNDAFYDKLPYDRKNELTEVSLITKVPNVLVVPPNSQFKTVQQLIAYARANPDKLSYASTGNGGSSHLSGELLSSSTGARMIHVPYNGGAAAQKDLLPGRVDFMFDSSSLPNISAGRVRALAVGTETRSKLLPDVPTLSEAGIKDFRSVTWFRLYAPMTGGHVPACVPKLAADVQAVMQEPEIREKLFAQGAEPVGSSPQEMQRWANDEYARWSAVVKRANIAVGK